MIALTLKEIAAACDGTLAGADPDVVVERVVIDSRTAGAGALFVALPGERADGHGFAADAIERGAVAVLATRAVDGPHVLVADARAALEQIARVVRDRSRARVVAITGSSGKTGTKDLVRAALESSLRTVASEASFNNELGVPLTIMAAEESTEVLVVEVGSRGLGHIAALMPLVRPDVSVVTNVGLAHVGEFGSIEVTEQAKGELVEALAPSGTAILNADDARTAAMAGRTEASVVTFGRAATADVRADAVVLDADGRASFEAIVGERTVPVRLAMPGEHMVSNALAALAVAHAIGTDLTRAAQGIASCTGSAWRMEVHDVGGRRIINDAYNANPDSMAAALKSLVAMGRGRPTWAVLGVMAELGDAATAEHDRIGRLAVRLGVGNLVVVGERARAIHEAARLEGMFGGETHLVEDAEAAVALLREALEGDAVVLVKASREAGLERVAHALGAGA